MTEHATELILNVDDNSGSLYAKTRVLRHAGFTVLEAQTGMEALTRAQAARPALVLLDVHLPDISGLEVCRRLKSAPTTARLFVLQISASFVEATDKVRGLDGGADGYLIEPVPPEELIATVRAYLRLQQAEAALHASEERYRTTFEHVAIGMAHVAINGRWLHVNERLCEILGYSRSELLQTDVQSVTHPDDIAMAVDHMATMAEGDLAHYTTEKRYLRKDGAFCWARISAVPLCDETTNTVRYFITAIEDISARKRAEDRLALMAEISRLLIAPLDYAEILQQVVERLTPQWADWGVIDLFNANDELEVTAIAHADPAQVALIRTMQIRLRRELQTDEGALRVARTGRSVLYTNIMPTMLAAPGIKSETIALAQQIGYHAALIVPLLGRSRSLGALTLVLGHPNQRFTEEDLTFAEEIARRMAVAVDGARLLQAVQETAVQLQEINATLQEQITQRTVELERRQRELDELAFVAADDLKTPLRGIKQLAGWIAEDAAEQLATASWEHLQKLRQRIQRMEQLLDDLLAYTRIGRREQVVEPVAVTQVVHEIVVALDPPAGFTVTIEGELPTLHTVRADLALVFRHLIGNAIKHHHQPETGVARVRAHPMGDFVEFTIADNGPGIAPHNHQRVFQLFQILRARDEIEASGMGLPMVKKTVEHYGGDITLDSSPGAGCTFRFTWPSSVVSTRQDHSPEMTKDRLI